MTEALHLAAGHVPMGVWLAVQQAHAAGYAVEVYLAAPVAPKTLAKRWRGNRTVIGVFTTQRGDPELVRVLRGLGFIWKRLAWRWEAR